MQAHFRKTFLAGAFAVIPVVVTIAIVIYAANLIDTPIRRLPFYFHGLGIVLALVLIYLVGLFVTSYVGKLFLRLIDAILERLPLLRELYKAWKQVSLSPGGGEGIYARVVLVPDGPPGSPRVIAFSTGDPIAAGVDHMAVFVPGCPNPVVGRVLIVATSEVIVTTIAVEDAFKVLLSSGNYIPAEVALALDTSRVKTIEGKPVESMESVVAPVAVGTT